MSSTESHKQDQEIKKAIFVGGLLDSTKTDSIENYFSKFGPIEEVNLIIDWVTGKSKRCAIVICEDTGTFQKILKNKKHNLDGRTIRVDEADQSKKGTKIVKTTKIFLGQVPTEIVESDLEDFFSKYGEIKHIKIVNRDNISMNFSDSSSSGYLEFYRVQDAQKLLQDRHNLIINGWKIFCQPFKAKNAQEGRFLKFISGMKSDLLEKALQMYFDMQASHVTVEEQISFYNYFEQFVKSGGYSQQDSYGNVYQGQNMQSGPWNGSSDSFQNFQNFNGVSHPNNGFQNYNYGDFSPYCMNQNYQNQHQDFFSQGNLSNQGQFLNQQQQQAQYFKMNGYYRGNPCQNAPKSTGNNEFYYNSNQLANRLPAQNHQPKMPDFRQNGYGRAQYQNQSPWQPLVNQRGPQAQQGYGQPPRYENYQGYRPNESQKFDNWNQQENSNNYGYQSNEYNQHQNQQETGQFQQQLYQKQRYGDMNQAPVYPNGFKPQTQIPRSRDFESTKSGPQTDNYYSYNKGESEARTRASQNYHFGSRASRGSPESFSPIMNQKQPLRFNGSGKNLQLSIRKFTEEAICHRGLTRHSALDLDDISQREVPSDLDLSLSSRNSHPHDQSSRLSHTKKKTHPLSPYGEENSPIFNKKNQQKSSIISDEEEEENLLKEAISIYTKQE